MISSFLLKQAGPSKLIPGFWLYDAVLPDGITLRVAIGGKDTGKTPLMLVHGHPHTHVIWRKVAPALGEDRLVIIPDLRGYGDSSKPAGTPDHRTYSKREMAKDLALLADGFGIQKMHFVGHDRGGRVGHRFALDYPSLFASATFLDIAPTLTMYEKTNQEFATRYFWWFFLIQPKPFPEKLILSDPEWFLRRHIAGQLKTSGACEESAIAEYLRCYKKPETVNAICEDYRAAATIDLEDDRADADKRITCPLLLLWGAKGTVGHLYDVVDTWRDKALEPEGEALPCGHSPEEECPELFIVKYKSFLARVEGKA